MLNGTKPTIKTGNSFALIPMGVYTLQVLDVNMDKSTYMGVEKDVLNYTLGVLDDVKDEDGQTTRGRYLWKRCSLSLNDKSWLNKIASAVKGSPLTEDEKNSFDAESLVGQQLMGMVEQKTKQDGSGVYNNILSFSKATKKLEPIEYSAKPSVIEKSSTPINIEDEVSEIEEEAKKK